VGKPARNGRPGVAKRKSTDRARKSVSRQSRRKQSGEGNWVKDLLTANRGPEQMAKKKAGGGGDQPAGGPRSNQGLGEGMPKKKDQSTKG